MAGEQTPAPKLEAEPTIPPPCVLEAEQPPPPAEAVPTIMMHKALPVKKVATKVIGQMLLLGIVGICAGGAYTSFHKDIGATANFCSLHSWLGIVTLALYAIGCFYFVWVFCRGGEERMRRPTSCKEHVLVGIHFILTFGSLVTGLLKKLTSLQKEKVRDTMALTLSFAAIGIVLYVATIVWIKLDPDEEAKENGDDSLPI